MARTDTTQKRLAQLGEIEAVPLDDAGRKLLETALLRWNNTLAARAARLIAAIGDRSFGELLARSFSRFMRKPVSVDPGCRAKTAVIDALNQLDYDGPEPFLTGIRHVQHEPVFGGREDTAPELRARCAAALLRIGYERIYDELVLLLNDSAPQARTAAVQVLGALPGETSEALLRFKALVGDSQTDVTMEVLSALVRVAPDEACDFVTDFLNSEDTDLMQGAALALAEQGGADVLPLLKEQWDRRIDFDERRALLLPIAMVRSDEAFAMLLELVRESPPERASHVLSAMDLCLDSPQRVAQLREAVEAHRDRGLAKALNRLLAPRDSH